MKQPADNHTYQWVTLGTETLKVCHSGVKYYIDLLNKDIALIEEDHDLNELLSETEKKSFAIWKELAQAKNVAGWLDKKLEEAGDGPFGADCFDISHRLIRYLKSVGLLYLKYLKLKRNKLSSHPNLSRHALETVDSQISIKEEQLEIGIFQNASPIHLLIEELIQENDTQATETNSDVISRAHRPKPVLIDSIQILDAQLRERCMDLFQLFASDGMQERLDTVLAEGTKILEDRLRKKSKADKKLFGPDLASHAFSGKNPILRISEDSGEQEAAHLIFRGVFGLIRNPAHHEFLGALSPERVLQLMGMLDYLIHLLEGAKPEIPTRKPPTAP